MALIRRREGGSRLPRLHVYERRRDVEAPDVGAGHRRLLLVVRRVQKWAKQCQGA